MDWDEFRDLQGSFLWASTPDGEIPTDHAIFALLYRTAVERGIRHVITGMNFRTEGSAVPRWAYGHHDWKYISAIHRRFGKVKLRQYPHYSYAYLAYALFVRRLRIVALLNYVNYDKEEVLTVLQRDLGYRPYEGKHYESIYTRFYQGYVLPVKFGIDKRKLHFSDLIRSIQMRRAEAVEALKMPPLDPEIVRQDRMFVIKKLGLTESSFAEIMDLPLKSSQDYPTSASIAAYLRGRFDALRRRGLIPK